MIAKTFPVALLAALAACTIGNDNGSARAAESDRGPVASRTLDVTGFDAISLSGCDRMEVRPGADFSAIASGPQRDLDQLRARVRGGRLDLDRADGCDTDSKALTIAVSLPALKALSLSGATMGTVAPFAAARFEASVSGAAQLDLAGLTGEGAKLATSGVSRLRLRQAQLRSLALDLSGTSHLTAQGNAPTLAIDASGTSAADTRELAAQTLTAHASGTAAVRARATGTAALSASGVAKIMVEGGAACAVDRSGVADVTCD